MKRTRFEVIFFDLWQFLSKLLYKILTRNCPVTDLIDIDILTLALKNLVVTLSTY